MNNAATSQSIFNDLLKGESSDIEETEFEDRNGKTILLIARLQLEQYGILESVVCSFLKEGASEARLRFRTRGVDLSGSDLHIEEDINLLQKRQKENCQIRQDLNDDCTIKSSSSTARQYALDIKKNVKIAHLTSEIKKMLKYFLDLEKIS